MLLCIVSNSLKLECDKLASEKSEMQRHYIMVSLSSSVVAFDDLEFRIPVIYVVLLCVG